MKKVLIVSHFWPYRGGSKRVIGLAKYLSEFGWEPVILTGPLNRKPNLKVRYLEVEYRDIFGFKAKIDFSDRMGRKIKDTPPFFKNFLRNVFKYVAEVIVYPDEYKYWKPSAVRAVEDILKKEKIDAIISIWPVTSHLIAKELKDKYQIPWIADFPDLWTQNHNYHYGFIRKFFEQRLEKKTLSSADALTTTSWPWTEKLRILHKNKLVYTINHGFDSEKVNIPSADLTSKFTITYTGLIYTGKQDPFKILIALKDLISEGFINPSDVEIRFYGSKNAQLQKKIKENQLSSFVKQYGIVDREISLEKQWESQILLLLNWEDKNKEEKGVYTGKIYEYLAAQRPILSTGGLDNDVIKELFDKTKAGVSCPGIEDIKKTLKQFYSEYKEKEKVNYKGNWLEINKYSHREMARKFVDILNKIT